MRTTDRQTSNGTGTPGPGNGFRPFPDSARVRAVSDAVTQGVARAGASAERLVRSAEGAVQKLDQTVDRVFGELERKTRAVPRTPYPGQVNIPVQNQQNRQTNGQPNAGYRYAPPTGGQPGAQRRPPAAPPRQAAWQQPGAPRPNPAAPVPPPQKYVTKRVPTNTPYWFVGILCLCWAAILPLYRWVHFALLAAAAVGGFLLGKKVFFKGKKVNVPVEEEKPAPKPVPEKPKHASTGDPEVDRIIDEGYESLRKLREANDRIPDQVMSERISRMENASADIFAYITDHPDQAPQIRRFMNYYLPTTLKLLENYEKLSRQRVKGQNVRKTMFEIEGIMETIAAAFEKQLDSLFSSDAMDISADISVMETVLRQEGLADGQMPEAGTGAAAKQTAPGPAPGIPTLTLDPDGKDKK